MQIKNPYLIALFASIVNSYDYALFGLTAGRLSREFFPGQEDIDKILNFFIIFSVTIIIRPFASLLFGIIGDSYGRAKVLRMAAVGIALPVCAIGFIPPYSMIGYAATLLFIGCRLLIIAFLAGEVDGIRIYIYEKINPKRRFFGSGLVTGCSQAGSLIAAFAAWFSGLDFLPEYAWRFNFMIGGIFGLIILVLREAFQETEEFLEYKKTKAFSLDSNLSIFQVIHENFPAFIRSTFVQGAIGGIYHFHIIFYSIYASQILKVENEAYIRFITILTIFCYMSSAFVSGLLHDRFNPKIIASAALLSSIVLSLLNMMNIANYQYNALPVILIGALTPLHTTAIFIFLKQQFRTGIKYRLFSFSHSLGSVLISSTTPIIAIKLWQHSHISWLPSVYLIILLSFLLWQIQNKNFGQNKNFTELE